MQHTRLKAKTGRSWGEEATLNICPALGGPVPSAGLEGQILVHIRMGPPLKVRPHRHDCVKLADLSKEFPGIPYHMIRYRVHKLARLGQIRIFRRGRSVMCCPVDP
jgi:hypothetical protein